MIFQVLFLNCYYIKIKNKVKVMLQIYRCLFLLFTLFFFTNLMALESNWSIGPESKVRLFSPTTHNNNNTETENVFGLYFK